MKNRALLISGIVVAAAIAVFLIFRVMAGQGLSGTAAGVKSGDKAMDVESALFTAAVNYEKQGELLKAKDAYQAILEKFSGSSDIGKAQEARDDLNVKMLFSPTITQDAFIYEVQKGDTLAKIAKKNNTTIELISKTNGITNGVIKIGQRLKITKLKFSIVVDKSQNILTLKADDNIFKTYRVATGLNNCTPVGTFKIINKLTNPVWYSTKAVVPSGSPENILGSRWLGISQPGYGIHGTTKPESIGSQSTAGCVRMVNSDVEELYSMVPEGTEVVIID